MPKTAFFKAILKYYIKKIMAGLDYNFIHSCAVARAHLCLFQFVCVHGSLHDWHVLSQFF